MAKKEDPPLIPVSPRVAEIVGQLAKERVVETLVQNVTHHSTLQGSLLDLVQIIYFALLQTDPARLEHLATTKQMKFYIVRMIMNQFFSQSSPFYKEIRRFSRRSSEISNQISETYEMGKDYTNTHR